MADYAEELESTLWFRRIDMIASDALPSIENELRHASHLLQLTPEPLRPLVGLGIEEEEFEALLDAGDFDAAARYLVAQPTALSVEGSGGDIVRATIQCSILGRPISGVAPTVAKAILRAWTTCLLAVRTKYGADLSGLADASPDERRRQTP